MSRWLLTTVTVALALGLASLPLACDGYGDEAEALPALPSPSALTDLDPANFVAHIDNPYWPMTPGARWVYRETDADGTEQRVEATVTNDTRTIQGITATVVHDVVTTEDDQLIEDTYDWYAQDIWR
jgi:hypothetical protein